MSGGCAARRACISRRSAWTNSSAPQLGKMHALSWAPNRGVDAQRVYLVKTTIIAIVKKAIVVIKTLWPQRAISPIMFNSNKFK
jgi:hypothetical protein